MDIVRFCVSIYKIGSKRSGRLIQQYRQALGLSPDDMAVYIMAALGRLGMELNHFPISAYAELCDEVFECLLHHVLVARS